MGKGLLDLLVERGMCSLLVLPLEGEEPLASEFGRSMNVSYIIIYVCKHWTSRLRYSLNSPLPINLDTYNLVN